MKRYILFLIAGAICLPVTYDISQNNILFLSFLIIFTVAATATFLSRRFGNIEAISASAAFSFGAACSSLSFYLRWKEAITTNYQGVQSNQINMLLEFAAISLIGAIAIGLMLRVMKKYMPSD